jgi:hypothetical protein
MDHQLQLRMQQRSSTSGRRYPPALRERLSMTSTEHDDTSHNTTTRPDLPEGDHPGDM